MEDNFHNSSGLPPFTLTGLPGLETSQQWMFCCLVLSTLFPLWQCPYSLHYQGGAELASAYVLFPVSTINDLGMSFSTLPTVLATFCFHLREISFDSCMAHMFFIHLFSFTEAGILLAMSFDRYVAICNPLRYATVFTDAQVMHVGMSVIICSFCMVFPLPFLLKMLLFCKANVLSHAYCLHPDLIHLPCGVITINNIFGLFIVISTFGLDSALILLSYVLILCSVLAIASQEEQLKTLNTCVSHICAVLIFYVPMVGVSMAACYGSHAPKYVHIPMSLIYLFVPPMLNPVIYSNKTKEIRRRLHKILLGTKF